MTWEAMAAFAAASCALAALSPSAVGALLAAKRSSYERWRDDSLAGLEQFLAETGRLPSCGSRDPHEKALALFALDCVRLADVGLLEPGCASRLSDAGIAVPDAKPRRGRGRRRPLESALPVGLLSIAGALAAMPAGEAGAGLGLLAGAACGVAVACDLAERTIPWESCLAIAAAGAALSFLLEGWSGVGSGALAAAVLWSSLRLADAFSARLGMPAGVGAGDARMAGAVGVCGGLGASLAAGAAVMGACALAALAWRMAVGKSGPVPLAPALALSAVAAIAIRAAS